MKKLTSTLFAFGSKPNMVQLTAEVKETIAFGVTGPGEKIFTAANLWHIQSQLKNRNRRKYF